MFCHHPPCLSGEVEQSPTWVGKDCSASPRGTVPGHAEAPQHRPLKCEQLHHKVEPLERHVHPICCGDGVEDQGKKSDQTNYILQHHKLYDGVHADDRLIEEWALKFERAIRKNRVAYRTVHYNSPLTPPLTDELVNSFAN